MVGILRRSVATNRQSSMSAACPFFTRFFILHFLHSIEPVLVKYEQDHAILGGKSFVNPVLKELVDVVFASLTLSNHVSVHFKSGLNLNPTRTTLRASLD